LNGIYLDYNACSPLRADAAAAIARVLEPGFGNPSSIHRHGHRSKLIVESARESVAALLGAAPDEIVFTSSGTEANNLAVLGAAGQSATGHIVASSLEHSSLLEPLGHLERQGHRVTLVPPDAGGFVDPDAVLRAVGPDTVLVSLIHSSNEVGTLQPVAEVAEGIRQRGVLLHTYAVQSAGKVPLEPWKLGVDLLSLSAHKLGGPTGVGSLWIRPGVTLSPLLRGGGQESRRRAGTEPVSLLAGYGAAASLALSELSHEPGRIAGLRDRLEAVLEERLGGLSFHGRRRSRLPNTISLLVKGCSGEEMVMALDLEGIAVSTGSACSVGTVRPSHVLTAMGCSTEEARSTLRISLGHGTTWNQLERFVEVLERVVGRMRSSRAGEAASSLERSVPVPAGAPRDKQT
jgi:cysteine desulfurase